MSIETYSDPGRQVAPSARNNQPVDVCLIVEGAYPYVSGGVSSWVHGLIRRQPSLRFCVVAILPEPPPPESKYGALPDLTALHHLYLSGSYGSGGWRRPHSLDQAKFDEAVSMFCTMAGSRNWRGSSSCSHHW